MNLLSLNSDAKTVKGSKLGVLTGILYLAPYDLSGYQTCPKSTAGCRAGCLFTAGMSSIYPEMIQGARKRKTVMFFEQRELFMWQLVQDIEQLIRKGDKDNMEVAIRLNGTSDIAWEKFPCIRNNVHYKNVMLAFPELQFYDYTKIAKRPSAAKLPNYHLTFSLAENNDKDALAALAAGMNVSVVIGGVTRTKPLPESWGGFPLVDGDVSDIRYKESGGQLIGLRAKGKARKDTTSGFVRPVDGGFIH